MVKKKILLCLVSAMVVTGLVGCSRNTQEVQRVAVASNSIEKQVIKGDIKEEISLTGSVKAARIYSVTGENSNVEEIYVQANEEVSEGEDLLLLENGNVIEAPIDGKITKVCVSEGDNIDLNTVTFNVADTSSYYINTTIDEQDITKVKVGQEVDVNITAIDKALTGTITSIDGEATTNGNSTGFGVVITLQGDFEDIYSGMSCEMNIIINQSTGALLVPIDAVKKVNGKYVVSVKNDEATKAVQVEVGLQDSSYVEILSGLKEGDTIVYSQASKQNITPNKTDIDMDKIKEMMQSGQMPGGGKMPEGMQRPTGGRGSN